ncbi:hypothetical protein [Allobaculum sp. Allo2]|uniref:hypothetical protein n=1 Tax=Allobaculum sp. Allo2 TaxID=2853432 RepID=UPI001F5FF90E|nr:hypothetical protein [Allobaculum sp. Allo2]UNT93906.1 hypothetical protein KWG61_04195 [Allobaculum sp. Allo2]
MEKFLRIYTNTAIFLAKSEKAVWKIPCIREIAPGKTLISSKNDLLFFDRRTLYRKFSQIHQIVQKSENCSKMIDLHRWAPNLSNRHRFLTVPAAALATESDRTKQHKAEGNEQSERE